jgi:Asp-tRNA(Asn)/Glu-tRNA(Gln) amidotransferase C subunit
MKNFKDIISKLEKNSKLDSKNAQEQYDTIDDLSENINLLRSVLTLTLKYVKFNDNEEEMQFSKEFETINNKMKKVLDRIKNRYKETPNNIKE